MRRARKITEAPHFLSGWKEIANYLGKGVRTVQRYELELGLPVRRPAGKTRGSVVATRAELDAWVEASPFRAEFRLARPMLGLSADATKKLSSGMEEMTRLRSQMQALREELKNSVSSLHQSMDDLWGRLYQNRSRWETEPMPARGGSSKTLN